MNNALPEFTKSLNQARRLVKSIPDCDPHNATDLGVVLLEMGQLRSTLREGNATVEDCLCGMAERIVELVERDGEINGRRALALVVEIIEQVSEVLAGQMGEDPRPAPRAQAPEGAPRAGKRRTAKSPKGALPAPEPEHSVASRLGLELMEHRKLGEMLVTLSMLSKSKVEYALEHQKASGKRLGETLIELGFINQVAIDSVLRLQRQRRGANQADGWKNGK